MKITRKENGLYQIDDISLEEMTEMITLYGVTIGNSEAHSNRDFSHYWDFYHKFQNELSKAINNPKNFWRK